jgi:hypothetical protein
MITAPVSAPLWAQDFARAIDQAVQSQLGPFVSLTPFTVANKPAAANFPWKLIFLSDGAANKFVAVSNGTAWYYLEGSAV